MRWLKGLKDWARGVRPPQALVVGAGVTGLTSAIFLDEAGFRTKVLEREVARRRSSTSTVLTRSALEGYDAVGLMGEILRASNPFACKVLNISDDNPRLDPRLRAPAQSRILPHSEMLDILDRAAESRFIPVLRGQRVIGVNQSPSRAYATLANGQRAAAAYLVTADGNGSVSNTAFGRPSASRRVRDWALSGISPASALPTHLADSMEPGVALMASAAHFRFVAQADDPFEPERIAWTIWLPPAERIDLGAVTLGHQQAQVIRAVRTLERFARDAVGLVQASQRLTAHARVAADPTATTRLGRIVTVGSASHSDHYAGLLDPATSYRDAMQVPDRVGLMAG